MDFVNITHNKPISANSKEAIVKCVDFAEEAIDQFGVEAAMSGLMSAFVTHATRNFGFPCTEAALRAVIDALPKAKAMVESEGSA